MSPKKSYEEIDFKYNLKVYFSFLKKHLLVVFVMLLMILFIESSHILNNYFLKVIIDNATKFIESSITKNVLVEILILVGSLYLVFTIIKAAVRYFNLRLLARLDAKMMMELKQKFFNHILGLSHDFHVTNKTGSLISRTIRGSGAIERMNDSLIFNFAPLFFKIFVVSAALYYFSLDIALITIGFTLLFLIYSFWLQRIQRRANLIMNKKEDKEKGHLADYLTNVDSIKFFGKENTIQKKYADLSENTRKFTLKAWDYYNWMESGQSLIIGLGIFAVMFVSIRKFMNGMLSVGDLMFVYTTYMALIHPMFSFVHGIKNFYRSMADMDALFQYGKVENEVEESKTAKAYKVTKGIVEFKDLTFGYTRRKIFKNLNLRISRNKKVALVGHSGCGKSTLVKLLYRLYDVEKGQILVDGKDIKEYKKEALRSEMSVVPQECVLFDDTIYNNIAFSNPKAKRKEVLEAIKFAQLDKIIENFPNGLETIVGERGVKLSGGEKQRVSIARALLADKKILVLDEATSALDSETEHEIQKDLEKLMEGRTSIIIAHRLSTIMKADEIIVMEKGKIMERGTHPELVKKGGIYTKLWDLQKGGYIK